MSDQRKKYTPAEKAKIALDAIKGELTLAQISSKYGVHSSQINACKKQPQAYLPDALNDKSVWRYSNTATQSQKPDTKCARYVQLLRKWHFV